LINKKNLILIEIVSKEKINLSFCVIFKSRKIMINRHKKCSKSFFSSLIFLIKKLFCFIKKRREKEKEREKERKKERKRRL